jgi:hypothetical protein
MMKKQRREQASVQRDMLRLRETWGEMLRLYAPNSPTRRSYRAVLEVALINLSLKAQDEQEAIIERFAALIKSLSFPLQILVRNRRQDLTPYIQHLLAHPEGEGPHPPTWYALAHSQADLLQKIVAERTLCWLLGTSVRRIGRFELHRTTFLSTHPTGMYNHYGSESIDILSFCPF